MYVREPNQPRLQPPSPSRNLLSPYQPKIQKRKVITHAYIQQTHQPKPPRLLQIRRRQRLHHTRALAEAGTEDAVRVLEHAVLERHDNKLRPLEARFDEAADVLSVRQVQRRVHLVQDVHGRRLELEQGHDEGEGDERPRQKQVS